jgi:hypothetical protein
MQTAYYPKEASIFMKSKKTIISLCIFLLSICTACQNRSTSVEKNIQDNSSTLLSFLVQQNEAPKEWKWERVYISQENILPSVDNGYSTEKADVAIFGVYKNKWVVIGQGITAYEMGVPKESRYDELNISSLGLVAENEIADTFSATFFQPSGSVKYICAIIQGKDQNKYCEIVVKYENFICWVTIWTPGILEIKDIENIVNPLLQKMDKGINY